MFSNCQSFCPNYEIHAMIVKMISVFASGGIPGIRNEHNCSYSHFLALDFLYLLFFIYYLGRAGGGSPFIEVYKHQ